MLLNRVKQNSVQVILWVTVVMLAWPALPASACHCSSKSQQSGCCRIFRSSNQPEPQPAWCNSVQARSCCFQNGNLTKCCCDNGTSTGPAEDCSCVNSCSCGLGQLPALSAEPLRPEEYLNTTLVDNFHANLPTPNSFPAAGPLLLCKPERSNCDSSLERCIILSRFTL